MKTIELDTIEIGNQKYIQDSKGIVLIKKIGH